MSQTKKSLEEQLLRLLKLPSDVTIDSSRSTLDTEIITLRLPVDQKRICPECGSEGCVIRGSGKWQDIKHFPVEGRRIILRIFKCRLFCPECKTSHYETPEWIIPRLRMSKALFKSIMIDFSEITAFTQISSDLMIGETTVRSVFDSIEILHPDRLPSTLCIDEFHADSGFYISSRKKWATDDYNVNITGWNNHSVVDILQQKNLVFLSKYFRKQYNCYQREKVLYFVCDMSGSFISLAKECFPHATICIDNFHVVQRLTKVVTDVRRRLQNNFKNAGDDDNYNRLKNIRYALTTAKYKQWEKWGDRAAEKAQRLLDTFEVTPELKEAYEAYQDFLLILASSPFSVQREELINWFHTYQRTDVPELRTALNTLRSLRAYILNAWKYERSNGPCEGLNKKIKDVKRSMYGAHSFENLRKRILLSCCSPNILKDQLVLHLDNKKGGSKNA